MMNNAATNDWEELSEDQRNAVQAFRERVAQHMIAETEAFHKDHPDLQLRWDFTADASLRGKYDTLAK